MRDFIVDEWDGKDLTGLWLCTYKIDGIQIKRDEDGKFVSKNNKPVYNLPEEIKDLNCDLAEVFCGSWGESWSILSASKSKRRTILLSEIFPIAPSYCEKMLVLGTKLRSFSKKTIRTLLKQSLEKGFEGLVFFNGERYVKVKPKTTVDVKVIGLVASEARTHKGLLKEFITEFGKVGIGLTREQRKQYMNKKYIGSTIEVEVTNGYTPSGKFRHVKFVRLRPDK